MHHTSAIAHCRFIALILTLSLPAQAERINQEGRILGPAPVVTAPTLFNTKAADAIVAAMQIMPVTSAWNEDITRRPLLANSATIIAQVKSDLLSSRQTLRPFYEMNYVLVPDNQSRLTIPFFNYPDESDLDGGTFPNGLYPIPPNMPVEGWPKATGDLTLEQWQQDVNDTGGDRHSIVVAPGAGSIWETWLARLMTSDWEASNGAKFDLNSNALRPAGWTSGDAAGLPMFPALVRHDECERGMVEHAVRLVVVKTRRQYIYPANHYASSIAADSTNYPAMGQRFRLKSSFIIPDNWTVEEKAVLRALKKYGGMVADNGNFFSFSVCPDDRFSDEAFEHLSTIDVDNFEVIETTGPVEGPRSPGAPSVDAGADQVVDLGTTVILHGVVNAPAGAAATQWKLYFGPNEVTLGSPASTDTSVNFTQPGSYVFELSADDGVHPVAYDAVVVSVMPQARMANLSTRAAVGLNENVSIGGFIVQGGAPKEILIRAIGPSLADLGLSGGLADPTLELHDASGNLLLSNDNWKERQEQEISETGLAPGDDRESAILATLDSGSYTAIVAGRNNAGGIGLTEIYDLQQSGGRLMNISTRALVGLDDSVMIGGVIITGVDPATILFRAIGPSLTGAGIQNPLPDPTLDLFDTQGTRLATNDNWKEAEQDAIEATGLGPSSDLEAALLVDLNPGSYTAVVRGADGTSGVALIEVYHLP
jgi:K319L-like, PKD domain